MSTINHAIEGRTDQKVLPGATVKFFTLASVDSLRISPALSEDEGEYGDGFEAASVYVYISIVWGILM